MADPVSTAFSLPGFRDTWHRLSGNTRGIVWVLAATLSRSVAGTGHKVVAVEVPDAQTLVFVRALVVLLMLLPVVLVSQGRAVRTRNVRLHVIRGLMIATSAFCSTYAVTHLTLAEANAYTLSASLFMLPLGALFLGERAHWLRWVGVTVGFLGVLLMLRPGVAGFQWAAVVALLAAGTDALLGVVLKHVSGHDGTVTIAFWSYVANAVVFGTLTGLQIPPLPLMTWGWVFLGGGAVLVVMICYIWAYRAGEASAVEAGSFSLLLWGALIGLALFGELPTLSFWTGAIMIGGIVLVVVEPTPQASAAQAG